MIDLRRSGQTTVARVATRPGPDNARNSACYRELSDTAVQDIGDVQVVRAVDSDRTGIVELSAHGRTAIARVPARPRSGDRRDDADGIHLSYHAVLLIGYEQVARRVKHQTVWVSHRGAYSRPAIAVVVATTSGVKRDRACRGHLADAAIGRIGKVQVPRSVERDTPGTSHSGAGRRAAVAGIAGRSCPGEGRYDKGAGICHGTRWQSDQARDGHHAAQCWPHCAACVDPRARAPSRRSDPRRVAPTANTFQGPSREHGSSRVRRARSSDKFELTRHSCRRVLQRRGTDSVSPSDHLVRGPWHHGKVGAGSGVSDVVPLPELATVVGAPRRRRVVGGDSEARRTRPRR